MPLNKDQQRAFDAYKTGQSVFVTGPAGTGKSYLIDSIVRDAKRSRYNVAVTSMTGVSALLIDGVTLHSYLGIGTGQDLLRVLFPKILKNKRSRTRWKTTDILIIDEVSMLDATLFDKLNNLACMLRESDEFFGGIQLIMVGDLFQLPPVKYESKGLLIQSKAFRKQFLELKLGPVVSLDTIVRQSDPVFTGLLMEVRSGVISKEGKDMLCALQNTTLDSAIEPAIEPAVKPAVKPTLLYTHRANVDAINKKRLEELPGQLYKFVASTEISKGSSRMSAKQEQFFKNVANARCPVPQVLVLKEGAQVMLTKNISLERGLANGSRGVVSSICAASGLVTVEFANGCAETLERAKWDIRIDDQTTVRRKQVPLTLAWATTIHKSQGATLDCVTVDLSRVFEYGQMYTALSRVRTIDGLSIEGLDIARLPPAKHAIKLAHPDIVAFIEEIKKK